MRAQIISLFREKYWHSVINQAITPKQALKEIKQEVLKGMKRK
jgi:predicted DNA-binding transcriptional regulator